MGCRRFLVSGRVQGVCYRAWTVNRAEQLGLTGWARNLPDGRVEVVARGPREAVESLRDALSEGPPAANVTGVEETSIEAGSERELTRFTIR